MGASKTPKGGSGLFRLRQPLSVDDPFREQVQQPPPSVEIEGKKEFEVEDLVDSLIKRKKLHYKIKWVGYDNSTIEPYEFVQHLKELLKKFY